MPWSRGKDAWQHFLGRNILIGHANWKGLYANNAVNGELLWENKDAELKYRSASVAWEGENLSFFPFLFYIEFKER